MPPAEIVKGMDTTEKQELYVLLRRVPEVVPQPDYVQAKLNQDWQLSCPHSQSERIHGHGGYKHCINKENILCSDAHQSIIAWAKTEGLVHHHFVATRQHVNNKCFLFRHVNSLAGRYARWIKRFYGVSAKYLPKYMNWVIPPEKIKHSLQSVADLARIVCSNHGAVLRYRGISDDYLEKLEPQFSKT